MKRALIAMIALIIISSGCIEQLEGPSTSSNSGSGLNIEEFSVSDNGLSANQEARVTLLLSNHNSNPVEFEDISLFNTGILNVEDRGCAPEGRMKAATESRVPEKECTWIVTAEELEDFESKNIPVTLNLEYETKFSPRDPVRVHFMPLEDIQETSRVSRSYSNGEVNMDISTGNPVAYGQRESLELSVSETGPGNVKDSEYQLEYSPSSIFQDCPGQKSAVTGEEVRINCGIQDDSGGSQVTRNLLISTSYKYVQQPSLDIRVVK